MPLEIKAQKAGLIIFRSGDSEVFEAFELSLVTRPQWAQWEVWFGHFQAVLPKYPWQP
jgi:hypothetical protein